jgi:signal transduction histidine kinase
MLLRTQIRIVGAAAAGTVLALSAALLWTAHEAAEAVELRARDSQGEDAIRGLALAASGLHVALDGTRSHDEVVAAFDRCESAAERVAGVASAPAVKADLDRLRAVLAQARADVARLVGPGHAAFANDVQHRVQAVVQPVHADLDRAAWAGEAEARAAVRRARLLAVGLAVPGVVAILVAAWWVVPRLRRGLTALLGAARRLRGGDLGVRTGLAGEDELAQLGAAFDGMAERLRETLVSREHLEAVVAERTADLERSRGEAAARLQELESARVHLGASERLASVGRLARGLAHEINNPLAVSLANVAFVAEELERQVGDPEAAPREELQHALEEAVQAGRRVSQIVRDLLAFSREPGNDVGPSDLVGVLAYAVRLSGAELRARARLSVEVGPGPILVRGGTAALGQVFCRLLLAAAAAIPPGDPEGQRVRVVCRSEGLDVVVEIRDSGEPIPVALLPHVFDPFFTPSAGFTEGQSARGLGLGLAACHGTIEALGGRLTAESAPGQDTVFRVRLPAGITGTRVVLHRGGEAARARQRVLVVSEDPVVCASVYRLLSAQNDVVPHTSAAHALTMVRGGERFDGVVCDAGLDGAHAAAFHAAVAGLSPALGRAMVFLVPRECSPETARFLDAVPNPRVARDLEDGALAAALAGAAAAAADRAVVGI